MNIKTKARSRILESIHDGAADLHRVGFIDKRKMLEYDALCLARVKTDASDKVAKPLAWSKQ